MMQGGVRRGKLSADKQVYCGSSKHYRKGNLFFKFIDVVFNIQQNRSARRENPATIREACPSAAIGAAIMRVRQGTVGKG